MSWPLQIQESFEAYGKRLPLRSAVIFGGVGQQPQVEQAEEGAWTSLVATPGRLLDLQGQGYVDLSRLEIFVLDEADRMLDMGFIHDVRRVLKLLPAVKQTLFFSATMPPEVMDLVNGLLKNPVKVAVDPVSSPGGDHRPERLPGGQGQQDQAAGLAGGGPGGEERHCVHPPPSTGPTRWPATW